MPNTYADTPDLGAEPAREEWRDDIALGLCACLPEFANSCRMLAIEETSIALPL